MCYTSNKHSHILPVSSMKGISILFKYNVASDLLVRQQPCEFRRLQQGRYNAVMVSVDSRCTPHGMAQK